MEENKENVVEETTQQEQPKEEVTKVDLSKFESKDDDSVIKVDLSKTPKTKEDTVSEQNTDEVSASDKSETSEKVVEEIVEEKTEEPTEEKEEVALEEITDEKVEELEEKIEEAVTKSQETGKAVPENIQKLMDFMEETGGDLEDYVRLNQDISKLNDNDVLYEYYKQTKPHLTTDEINFLMEDSFSYDEEIDEERDIKRKKLALKEQVASAKSHLDGQKSKYYKDIKAGSKLTLKQQKAVDFFNRYNKETEENQKIAKNNSEIFTQKTDKVFNDDFKGFEYNVGEKRYRYKKKKTSVKRASCQR